MAALGAHGSVKGMDSCTYSLENRISGIWNKLLIRPVLQTCRSGTTAPRTATVACDSTLRKSVCCTLPDFWALMEYSPMYIRGLAATGGRDGIPAQVIKCSSTRSTPHTRRLVLRTGPPPMRQFTSMRRGPRDVYFSSTWKTPCAHRVCLKPNAHPHTYVECCMASLEQCKHRDIQCTPLRNDRAQEHGGLC